VGARRVARERTVSPLWGFAEFRTCTQGFPAKHPAGRRPGLGCAAPCLPAGRLRGFKQIEERCCQAPDGVGTGSGWRYKMRGGWARVRMSQERKADPSGQAPAFATRLRRGYGAAGPPSPGLRRGKRLRRAGGMTTLRIEAKPHPLSAAADKGWATRCVPRPDLGFR
jgi:hypothetical protein